MLDFKQRLRSVGVRLPQVLLPNGVDFSKWAAVACDQYTSEPSYWQGVESFVGNAPSALNLILPEIYLEEPDVGARIESINRAMESYLRDGVLWPLPEGFVLVQRDTPFAKGRLGLVLAVDLEHYDFSKGSTSPIRATEGTILERLPPRMRIRKNALIELSHIQVLIDDPDSTVIEPIARAVHADAPLYDFDLMMDSGHVRGFAVNAPALLEGLCDALESLRACAPGGLLFAVGDGNHSLATAKACWEEIKPTLSGGEIEEHPARFALVELVNIHDPALSFEPIHRVLFSASGAKQAFERAAAALGTSVAFSGAPLEGCHSIETHSGQGAFFTCLPFWAHELAVGALQAVIDRALAEDPALRVDYIHGADVVRQLSSQQQNLGFLLPPMDKSALFHAVAARGALPRKTFSMGEASEKRFYLEARRIRT